MYPLAIFTLPLEKMDSQQCCLHVLKAENGELIQFSDRCWNRVLECADKWKKLDGVCKDIADKFSTLTDISNPEQRLGLLYHFNCYKRFTDKLLIEKAEKYASKSESTSQSQTSDRKIDTATSYIPPRKITRQSAISTPTRAPNRRNEIVLPEECIICKHDKFVKDRISRKRVKEKLSNCELPSGRLIPEIANTCVLNGTFSYLL